MTPADRPVHMNPNIEATKALLDAAGVAQRLAEAPAVVLERIARGGGATNWYWVRTVDELDQVCILLRPASVISFYFDDRIKHGKFDDRLEDTILAIAVENGEATVGALQEDGLCITVEYVAGASDLSEFVSTLLPGDEIFYGPFPARDNDGVQAITLLLPDVDGVFRDHPH